MDLTSLQAFVKVVQAGSFTRAAAALDTQKAHLSRVVSQLERELGARLLERTTRALSLTELGREFFERAVGILASVEDAQRAIQLCWLTGMTAMLGGDPDEVLAAIEAQGLYPANRNGAGHAWAASVFRQGGVAVRSAAEDTERVRRLFVQHVAVPKRTLLHGQSWGAGVAANAAEMYPRSWDGVRVALASTVA